MSVRRSASPVVIPLLTVLGSLVVAARAADPPLASTWTNTAISADGTLLEWSALKPVAEGLQVAVANDHTTAYFAVLASDEQMRVSLSGGLVLWIDPSDARKETFGLQLPGPLGAAVDAPTATGGVRLTPRVSDHIDLLGPGKLTRRLVDLTPSSGVAVATGGEDGGIAWELRLPLARTSESPLGVGAAAGQRFALGIATPVRRKGPREPMEPIQLFDPYQDLRYARYRRPLPPTVPLSNSRDRPEKEVKPKNVSLWMTVRLAQAP